MRAFQCKWCYNIYFDIYGGKQKDVRQICPYCMHCNSWVIDLDNKPRLPSVILALKYMKKLGKLGIVFSEKDEDEYLRYMREVRYVWKKAIAKKISSVTQKRSRVVG